MCATFWNFIIYCIIIKLIEMYEVYYTIEYSTNLKCINQYLESMAGQH